MAKKPNQTKSQSKLDKRIIDLEKQNKNLKNQLDIGKNTSKSVNNKWYRSLLSFFSMFVASVLIVLSVSFAWIQQTLFNTDNWVATTSEIINTESVENDISNKISTEVFNQIDVEQYVKDALPDKAKPLSAPIASGIEGFVSDKTSEFIKSDQFKDLWVEVNREAHSSLVDSIKKLNDIEQNNTSANVLFIEEDNLMLNLRPLIDEVKTNLVEKGLTFLPEESKIPQEKLTFQLAHIENLSTVLGVINFVNSMSYWLPILGVMFALIGIYVSNNKRKAMLVGSIIGIVLIVLQIQLIKTGQFQVSQLVVEKTQGLSTASTVAVYDILTTPLVTSLRFLMAGYTLLILFLILTGPSSMAVWIRNQIGKLVSNRQDSKFISWIGDNAYGIITGLGLLIATIIVLVPLSTPWIAVWLIVIGGILSVITLAIKQENSK